MKEATGIFLLTVVTLISTLLLRKCVYHFAFYGMSKTRKKKICREQSMKDKILLSCVLKYNNPDMTKWCFIWYHVFTVTAIVFIILAAINIFVTPTTQIQALAFWLGLLLRVSFCLCLFSVVLKPAKNHK
ncbi:hypothetical protein [Marasmitruncus massiliensis]|uniref:hypothetical protein n=1 Tax=Marasmitruncus massiliensis TaxID=1944642 RepID=UPI000C79E5FD|nr:hypothetical protein [Marasmitruncus massiliensis]